MPAPDPNIEFYDDLADTYHRMYEDWWGFAVHYGQAIATYLAAEGIAPPAEVLDVTCGIGTQALPLAAKGYRVTGSDLSERAVERARREAASRDLDVQFITSDMRQVSEQLVGTFDAVISGANSLTHLLTDDDLMLDLAQIRSCLRPGGVFLATIRDYDKLALDDSQGRHRSISARATSAASSYRRGTGRRTAGRSPRTTSCCSRSKTRTAGTPRCAPPTTAPCAEPNSTTP